MLPGDSENVLEIYRMGLETGNATFETNVPSWQEWDSNIWLTQDLFPKKTAL